MKINFSKSLIELAKNLEGKLYVVGGFIRDFLISGEYSSDIDLASPFCVEKVKSFLAVSGLKLIKENVKTSSLVFSDDKNVYEYTSFRKEKYEKGHLPFEISLTEDLEEDAKRRDFKCNAVYYDILNQEIIDPLGGVLDIQNKILSTTVEPKKVFSIDGVRLLRLARFSGELGFSVDKKALTYAKKNRAKIKEISNERIFEEFSKILYSDTVHSFSLSNGHFSALRILDKIGVLDLILPEILGKKGEALKRVLFCDKEIRLSALLLDCSAKEVLNRFKASKKETERTIFLTENLKSIKDDSEENIRIFIVKNQDFIENLFKLKRAVIKVEGVEDNVLDKWISVYEKMKKDGTPFSIKGLKISTKDLVENGIDERRIGKILKELFFTCVKHPENNDKNLLLLEIKLLSKSSH